ncbi:two-component system OmpR family response regulator/two-component system response regulator MprA [Kribbella sp. VKM Ac-2527]|uniref:Two-component system OmpR family response regulator/two-component system response regulator MprA n=1 Tax=Kribbella caucasensis TaxID=2512215 RepID=A0A4R6J4U4_9ACTN|nr:response regulator transcription factor [Kribbella sp. VKM Ac-2527]TDO30424.1 two-component system OmpR family response regulator/two-component system response regulator MprA [Kribbella sp. VKM Ac-2527]
MNSARAQVPQLLVVDDDRKLVPLLERGLRYEGFGVVCAYSGAEALAATKHTLPDLVLLDVGMPDLDGFGVLQELRRHTDVPVVMLTAKDEVSDKVGALGLGADDYVAKPFDFDELVARIRAVLRRRGADALDRFSYDDLTCDLGTREVVRGGRRIDLTVTEFDLLSYLLRNPRRFHSREGLLRAVWGYDVPVDSNVVDVHIGHLRRKLGDPPLIQTMRGVGYALRSEP